MSLQVPLKIARVLYPHRLHDRLILDEVPIYELQGFIKTLLVLILVSCDFQRQPRRQLLEHAILLFIMQEFESFSC